MIRVGHPQNGKFSVSVLWWMQTVFEIAVFASSFASNTNAFLLPNQHTVRTSTARSNRHSVDPSLLLWSATHQSPASSTSTSNSLEKNSQGSSGSVRARLGRRDAQSLLDDPGFLPSQEYGDRIAFGRQAAEQEYGSETEEVGIMLPDDPRLVRTYAEFPLASLDVLLDAATRHLPTETTNSNSTTAAVNMVDIGSGLGRIVLYSALTRGINEVGNNVNWKVRGIEISSSLHNKALEVVQTGVDREMFEDNDGGDSRSVGSGNSFSFHCGSATDENGRKLLKDAHLVFAYSTAFKATGFDPDVGALILDTEEWSLPLSEACPDGCVVITTDRALNPNLGWRVVERIDVPNPEVLGTTGFVHVLEKERTNE